MIREPCGCTRDERQWIQLCPVCDKEQTEQLARWRAYERRPQKPSTPQSEIDDLLS